jgi:uncharacterized membrane protein
MAGAEERIPMLEINERLNNLESRLLAIEVKLGLAKDSVPRPESPQPERPWAEIEAPQHPAIRPLPTQSPEPVSTTQLMAWAAGFALLLAAIYFLKLVYDVGWLTPDRQLLLAGIAGFTLIGLGLFLARIDRSYAAYLPAVGLIVLYLTVYAAHLYYHLWSSQAAIAATSAATVLGIWLGRRFNQSVYVVLAISLYVGGWLYQSLVRRMAD